ncbi:MAG: glycosyltransferase [Anaerolineae bacterium]|nr:glycosyltransferase [Anaerolineae bacterium]MCX8068066.1 glycosyltransferase [Anaerolineae bacterium]MDW7990931.1 glycosyltransferase [Anaerolineae bacterium]
MHIAQISVHTCPLATLGGKETGGMNVYVRDLSRELARRGHWVDVYTRSQDPTVPRISTALGRNARVIHIPAGPEQPYPKHKVYDHLPEFVEGVLAQAEADGIRYDVIHSHYWLSGWVARELRRHWGAPIVHMFHTLGHLKNAVARTPQEREPPIRLETEAEIVQFADRIIAATPLEQEQLVQFYGADPARIRVIPPGVDLERFRPIPPIQAKEQLALDPTCRTILFVGRIEPLKGIETLLRAIAHIARRYPELICGLCVPIIGGDPYRVEDNDEMVRLQELREELGIERVVTFLGAQDQDTLPYYYSAAEMVVMPSDYESFGMVALEAMACGTPVIASDVGGLAFLVRHGQTGYRVPARDEKALAAKIVRLLTDEGLRRRMGERAACWAERFAWPRIADQIEEVYAEARTSPVWAPGLP